MAERESSLKSVSVLSLCSLVQLLLQFAFQLLLALYFGVGSEMDVFVAAWTLPTVVSTILAGSLGYAFVPVFVNIKEKSGNDQAWQLASTIGLILLVSAVILVTCFTVAAAPLMATLHPGFSVAKVAQTTQLFQILVWTVLTNSLIGYARALYHCHGQFAATGLAPLVGNTITLVYTWMGFSTQGISAVAWGLLWGSLANMCFLMPLLVRNVQWRIGITAPVRRCFHLMLPLVVGAAYYNLDPLLDRYLASDSDGNIARLGYATRMIAAMVTISASGLAVVAFPAFSIHAAAEDDEKFRAEIAFAFRLLVFITIPIMIGLLLFSEPLTRDLLERGEFTSDDSRAVGMLLVLFVGWFLCAGIGEITSKVFYSQQQMWLPVLIAAIGFSLGAALKLWWSRPFGIEGIAAATSTYFLFNTTCFLLMIRHQKGNAAYAGVVGTLGRAVCGSMVAAAVGYLVIWFDFPFCAIVASVVGLSCYYATMYCLRDELALKLSSFIADRFRSNKNDVSGSETKAV